MFTPTESDYRRRSAFLPRVLPLRTEDTKAAVRSKSKLSGGLCVMADMEPLIFIGLKEKVRKIRGHGSLCCSKHCETTTRRQASINPYEPIP